MPQALDRPLDGDRLAGLIEREERRFVASHPRSRELFERGEGSLLAGVPMPWMTRVGRPVPGVRGEAEGARFTDVDGNDYVDLCLGDTGAMTGHAPAPTVPRRSQRAGATGSPDAADRGRDLGRRGAGTPLRPAALAVRPDRDRRQPVRDPARARRSPGGRKVLVYNWCYHGTVDETFAIELERRDRARARTTSARRSTRR